METLFVLFLANRLVGVYTTHRKAMQAVLLEAVPKRWKMTDYSFQFGAEFFTYEDDQCNEMTYELMEVTPDKGM